MREIRQSGSEGGATIVVPTPIREAFPPLTNVQLDFVLTQRIQLAPQVGDRVLCNQHIKTTM
jgi:hypothetical protein